MTALDELEALVAGGRAIPLTSEVRVEGAELRRCVDAIVRELGRTSEIDDLDGYLSRLRRVPLTSQVRVDQDRAGMLLSRIRAAGGSTV